MAFDDSETVESEEAFWSSTLFKKQLEQTQNMRSTLLSCDESDPFSVRSSMQKLLVMRIYHQVTRIIRYTEEMDKIEQKLYQVIDMTLDKMDPTYIDENTSSCLSMLLTLQQKIQQSMIDSQKLLDPYLNIDTLKYIDISVETEQSNDSGLIAGEVLDSSSRKRLREGAQAALTAIQHTYNQEEA